jgi:hypothetical protein
MTQMQTAASGSVVMPGTFARRYAKFAPAAVTIVPRPAPERQVVWVYAVTADVDPHRLDPLTGVGGEELRIVEGATLRAIVGSVDAADFGEDALSSVLADLTKIELMGRVHHEVIETVAAAGPVVPMRLATIYPDDDTIRALLSDHRDELSRLLRSLTGMQEWGVKVYLQTGAAAAAVNDTCAGEADAPDDDMSQQPRWQKAEACARQIDRALSDMAIEARRHPAPDLRFASDDGWLVLNGVYLVSASRAGEFADLAQRLAAEHAALRAQVTGPWPPYSFVDCRDA